jgi:hypothetical protein
LSSRDDPPRRGEIVFVHHDPHRDQQVAAIGNARATIERDRIQPLRIQSPDDDVGEITVVPPEFDEARLCAPLTRIIHAHSSNA